ncbi:solute carrier family 17 member 9 isoform X3 [Sturnira hondurensis]|uniref:solute carrier family 17 member 9 isoform X3 n=1 Tax=Sturnira hondurensis TaxID=192404 RepID=UPI00187A88F1|nr:solute carrier family 17 member 9 isoform X3 [Sturnira hondurensis]
MDRDAAAGHVPALLRPRQHAHLHGLHEPGLWLEQERSRDCAQQLLLGLLPDAGRWRPPGGPDRGREGHPVVGLGLGPHHCRHSADHTPGQRPPGLHDLLAHPHRLAARGLLPCADQPAVAEGPGERACLHLQRRGGWLPDRDTGDGGGGLPAPGLLRLAQHLLPLRRPHPAVGVLRVQVPAEQTRAAIFSQLSSACSFFILLSWLPTFFRETFPSSQGWVFNVVPWLVAVPASLFSGFLSDHLISQGYRTIVVRKFMQVMGLGLSSVFALCLGHTSSFCKSVFFAAASIGLQTFNHSGISVNIQDLAPSCAGVLFGVANTAGALAGVVGVGLGGYLIETTGSWTSLFHLVAAISSLGLCSFLVFGKAQRVDLGPAHQDL